jgi:oligopeptide transport system ATP-binding protein
MSKEIAVSMKDVVVKFEVRGELLTAIRNISLDIYRNETIALVGESGSGKSVLTKTMTGMLEANGHVEAEHIMYEDLDLSRIDNNEDWLQIRGKKIATIFQDPMTSLNPLRSIGSQIQEVIELHQGLSKADAKKEAISLLNRVGIDNAEGRYKDYPFQYSGGMRQRVVIAVALACKPEIIICDEPTTALDVTVQAQVLDLLKELQKEYGLTVVFITHDLGVVANIADRVAVMYFGQIIEIGNVEEVFYDPKHPYTWALLSSLPQIGTKGEKLFSIVGTPPSLYTKAIGDAFAPRNPFAMQIDFEMEPPMFQVTDTHFAKTWLLDPRAPKVEKPAIITNLTEKLKAIQVGDE